MTKLGVSQRAAIISLVASIVVLGLKYWAYYLTHSHAVLSDATESIVNVLTASIALWVIRFASQPADKEHPYGHGKAEYFSAVVEGGMILFAGAVIVTESVRALLRGVQLQQMDVGFAVMVLAGLINLGLGFYLKKMGERENSEALRASGAHVLSDFWTSAGVMIGLVFVWITGFSWLDPVVAIVVGLGLLFSGIKIIKKSISALIDEVDLEALQKIQVSFNSARRPGIIDIHHVKAIRSGSFHHIDAHLVIPEYWEIAKAHSLAHDFEEEVVKSYGTSGEIAFHLDPCKRSYCQSCNVFDCPIRAAEFKELRSFTTENITSGPRPDIYGSEPS